MRIGIQIQPQHADYADLREAAKRLDAMGVDVIYTWDHFFPLWSNQDGKHFECWTTLASLAEVTERAQIGALVTANSYRNPNLLADMARTVDHISSGRLILGIGAGWAKLDYEEYGYEFGTAGSRLRDLRRDMPIIRERLEKLNPPPLGDMPILIGGGGERVTLRIVAEHADIWHAFGDPETFIHKSAVLNDWCAEIGRDAAEIESSVGISDPQDFEAGDAFLAAGAGQLTFGVSGPDYDLSNVQPWLDWRDRVNQT
ncbi:LLM class F420-dependent oxidoreductase [soil metagenome]